jgi:hypothetical protein
MASCASEPSPSLPVGTLLCKLIGAIFAQPLLPFGADDMVITYDGEFVDTIVYKRGGKVIKTVNHENDGTNITRQYYA